MDNPVFAMTSEWMENGNIREFIKTNQDANRFELVGSPLHYSSNLVLNTPR